MKNQINELTNSQTCPTLCNAFKSSSDLSYRRFCSAARSRTESFLWLRQSVHSASCIPSCKSKTTNENEVWLEAEWEHYAILLQEEELELGLALTVDKDKTLDFKFRDSKNKKEKEGPLQPELTVKTPIKKSER